MSPVNFSIKVLGVTLSSNLSASDHIHRVISDSAQSLYVLRVLRHHGMNDVGLQIVSKAVVVCVKADVRLARVERLRNGDGP